MADSEWIVSRPLEIVQLLPPAMRWEVTRRNPLYLMFRDAALAERGSRPDQQVIHDGARILLMQIGMTGNLPSPTLSADQLDDTEIESIWEEGAVAPMSIRGLVTILAGHMLSADTKRSVAEILMQAADVHADDSEANLNLIKTISKSQNPQFDLVLPNLAVAINPRAPMRAIASAIDTIVRQYREQSGIAEQRRRDDKIEEYLRVWDLREGWNDGTYDCRQERSFQEISRETGKTIATLHNQYQSAFRYIIGRHYSPELWSRTVGIPKMAGMLGVGHPRITQFRPRNSRRRRDVTSTALSGSPEASHSDFMQSAGMNSTDIEQFELLHDIRSLIANGRTNEEILDELEIPRSSDAPAMIDYFRERLEE